MFFWPLALAIIIIDQATKFIIKRTLAPEQTISALNNRIHITHMKNPGAAFGLISREQAFFLFASISIIFIILGYKLWRRPKSALANMAFSLVLGGTVGNLIDRLLYGTVIDWLDIGVSLVFNIADVALLLGLALCGLAIARKIKIMDGCKKQIYRARNPL